MKNFYIAVNIEEEGKMFADVIKTNSDNNLLSELAIKNIVSANICETKSEAVKLVEHWNNCYKANGTYLFADSIH